MILKHYRKIYEQHYGPIPKDDTGRTYEIHHKDGNRKNNDIENLQCVSIQEHYDIHYSQGDWAACQAISKRMNISPEENSKICSDSMKKLWQNQEFRDNLILKLKNKWTPEYTEKRLKDGSTGFKNINYYKRAQKRKENGDYGKHRIGYVFSDISKSKMSEKAKNREKIVCPICFKEGAKPQMIQWHFNKCKGNTNVVNY